MCAIFTYDRTGFWCKLSVALSQSKTNECETELLTEFGSIPETAIWIWELEVLIDVRRCLSISGASVPLWDRTRYLWASGHCLLMVLAGILHLSQLVAGNWSCNDILQQADRAHCTPLYNTLLQTYNRCRHKHSGLHWETTEKSIKVVFGPQKYFILANSKLPTLQIKKFILSIDYQKAKLFPMKIMKNDVHSNMSSTSFPKMWPKLIPGNLWWSFLILVTSEPVAFLSKVKL